LLRNEGKTEKVHRIGSTPNAKKTVDPPRPVSVLLKDANFLINPFPPFIKRGPSDV
jgi:hypothetical protein